MKTRIIVWALVGLVVIGAGVFFVATSAKRPAMRKTLEAFRSEADRTARQLDRLAERQAGIRAGAALSPELEQKLDEASRLSNEARAKLEQVRSAANEGQAEALLREAKQLVRKVRRAVGIASGPSRRR